MSIADRNPEYLTDRQIRRMSAEDVVALSYSDRVALGELQQDLHAVYTDSARSASTKDRALSLIMASLQYIIDSKVNPKGRRTSPDMQAEVLSQAMERVVTYLPRWDASTGATLSTYLGHHIGFAPSDARRELSRGADKDMAFLEDEDGITLEPVDTRQDVSGAAMYLNSLVAEENLLQVAEATGVKVAAVAASPIAHWFVLGGASSAGQETAAGALSEESLVVAASFADIA